MCFSESDRESILNDDDAKSAAGSGHGLSENLSVSAQCQIMLCARSENEYSRLRYCKHMESKMLTVVSLMLHTDLVVTGGFG